MNQRSFEVCLVDWATHHEALSQIRFTVFVREQGVPPELELDARDADSTQVVHVAAKSATGELVGTARMILEPTMPRIGRMAVLKQWRGSGAGRAMLEFLCETAKARGADQVRLFAQTHATPFYYKQGFLSHGAEFTEAGIPHLEMRRAL